MSVIQSSASGQKLVKKLVADSAAFINNVQMQNIAEMVYSVQDVIDEIKHAPTRQRLQVLPYELKLVEPMAEAVKFVTDFSKKTGDYASLSATDIKVLALTYQLEVEAGGRDKLKTEPSMTKTVIVGRGSEPVETLAGFYRPKSKDAETTSQDGSDSLTTEDVARQIEAVSLNDEQLTEADESNEKQQQEDADYEDVEEEAEEEEEDVGEEEKDDDDGGWITPSNIGKVKHEIKGQVEECQLETACLTTDFAMQNVLVQIGLHVVSPDGKLIRQARTYILRCYACFKTTSNITKVFCPSCGNKTLKKVAVTLNEDGSLKIHISSRHRLTPRGKKFSLPTPKGGKYANNPILVEDQREAQKRATRMGMKKTNALDPDYIAGNSPFAMNDVYSRASMLGRTGHTSNHWNRRNPNELKKKKR